VSARKPKPADLATLAVHAGNDLRDVDNPVVHPLVQSVNFIQEVGTGEGLRYPRYGNAPNAEVVQKRVAALEGAEAAVLLGSGMGATACALIALLRPGDHLLASSRIYGGASALMTKEFSTLGINVRRTRLLLVIAATIGTAAAVAVSGLIAFVGIIVPHAIRLLTGAGYRALLPLSAIAGAGFLVLCDVIARTAAAPAEIPIGIITAFFGAPFFAIVLRSTKGGSR